MSLRDIPVWSCASGNIHDILMICLTATVPLLHVGIRYKLYCKKANVTFKAFYTEDADLVGNKSTIISSTLTKPRVWVHHLPRCLFIAINFCCMFPSCWFIHIQGIVTLGFCWVSLLWKNIVIFFFYVCKCFVCIYICVPCSCSVPLRHQNC